MSLAAVQALEELAEITGESNQTLTFNQALVAYAFLRRNLRQGTLKFVRPDGQEVEIMFL